MSHQDHTTAYQTPAAEATADPWHHHGADEAAPQAEHAAQVNPIVLGKALALIIVSTLALMLITVLYFKSHFNALHRERTDVDLGAAARDYRAASKKNLAEGDGWADPAAGRLRVPIENARKRVVDAYAKGAKAE
ncbi:MAG: hypothetical protein HRU70_03250 [Phycisphaeraceae bacterium]|nr:MAG: hypothetical protein HRU70_03250 [Phycisphaeraceae bacterium]